MSSRILDFEGRIAEALASFKSDICSLPNVKGVGLGKTGEQYTVDVMVADMEGVSDTVPESVAITVDGSELSLDVRVEKVEM